MCIRDSYKTLQEELEQYQDCEVVWCQEEPKNMGAWEFVKDRIMAVLGKIKSQEKNINFIVQQDENNSRVDILINQKEKLISRNRVKNLILKEKLKLKIHLGYF